MSMRSSGHIAAFVITILLTGCTTLDPYTREEKTSNATMGAAIGAAAGVAVGLITGDSASERRKQALILGGVGALSGAGVGYYMDQQEMKLRQQLDGTGVSVTRTGDNITLNMPGNITFAVDSADINMSFYEILDSVALVLKEFDRPWSKSPVIPTAPGATVTIKRCPNAVQPAWPRI